MVQAVEFFEYFVLLSWGKRFSERVPAIILISCFLLKLVIYQLGPVLPGQHAFVSFQIIEKLPIGALFG